MTTLCKNKYLSLPLRQRKTNPVASSETLEVTYPSLQGFGKLLIFSQTLREAPSGPHVSGMGKHVTCERSPSDAHCFMDFKVFKAFPT